MENLIIDTESFKLTQADFLIRFLVVIGIGFLIGLEREHDALREKAKGFAGIRTMVFVVLLGFLGGMAYFMLSPYVYLAILLGVVILTGLSYYVTAIKGDIGATTEFTVLLGFLLGTLTFLGMVEITLMITVVMVVLLSSKVQIQNIVGAITADEMFALIRFVVMALLIFPFLPNQTFGPYNILNPHEIGWVVLLTSGLGLAGYVLMKFLGPQKGILLSGIVGGIISSTAVTWVFSKKSQESDSIARNCAVAILAASSIMVVRVGVWLFIFNKSLYEDLFLTLMLMFLAGLGVTLVYHFGGKGKDVTEAEIRQGKPLDLSGALTFGGVYVLILLVVSYANDQLGGKGLLISSAIAGLSDIDAITITVSKLAGTAVDISFAGNAIMIAAISNTLVKMGIGLWRGSKSLRRYLLLGYGVIIAMAALSIILFNVLV